MNLIKETETTGYALFNVETFQGLAEFSLTNLIIIVATLILLIIAGFILYKKLKKNDIKEMKKVSDKPLTELNKKFNMPMMDKDEKHDSDELNTDLNKLFMEEAPLPQEKTEVPKIIEE